MKTLKDIFVSYEIAQKLKEIGFDSECIGYYNNDKEIIIYDFEANERDYFFIAPTWEQVKKWFREKEFDFFITPAYPQISFYKFKISDYEEMDEYVSEKCKTYEQAREQLILKLIEIYKNGKQSI